MNCLSDLLPDPFDLSLNLSRSKENEPGIMDSFYEKGVKFLSLSLINGPS